MSLVALVFLLSLLHAHAWDAPPAKSEAAHTYVKPCGDGDYLASTGKLCNSNALITSDGKKPPQNRVKCHKAEVGSCKPWYWCEQYARPMDILFILDSSRSIGNKWQNLMKVVIAIMEGLEETVYPNVQCDTDYRTDAGKAAGHKCKFRMGMQMWGFTNNNNELCGRSSCRRVNNKWVCDDDKNKYYGSGGGNRRRRRGFRCKVRENKRTLPCYYPDPTIPKENQVSGWNKMTGDNGDNGRTYAASLGVLPHMEKPQEPSRLVTETRGWADTRDPAEWAQESGATNQVAYLKWVAQDWHDNWYDCFPRTQYTKPLLDCLNSVKKANPLSNQEADAFRMCFLVTDGAPWRDGFPDMYASPVFSNMKWAQREVKINGVETVGVYLSTTTNAGSEKKNALYTYCIASCFDKTDYGKSLPNDSAGYTMAFDFDTCFNYMNANTNRANGLMNECKFYIDGNVSVGVESLCVWLLLCGCCCGWCVGCWGCSLQLQCRVVVCYTCPPCAVWTVWLWMWM